MYCGRQAARSEARASAIQLEARGRPAEHRGDFGRTASGRRHIVVDFGQDVVRKKLIDDPADSRLAHAGGAGEVGSGNRPGAGDGFDDPPLVHPPEIA